MNSPSIKKLNIQSNSFLIAGIASAIRNSFQNLNKKIIIQLALVLSLIFTALSLLIVQLLRAVNGQAVSLLSETTQSIQLQADLPSIAASESETVSPVSSASTSNSSGQPNVKVVINGENIPVPANGTVHREVKNDNGQSNVSVTVQDGQVTTSTQTTNVSGNSFNSTYSSSQQFNNGVPQ